MSSRPGTMEPGDSTDGVQIRVLDEVAVHTDAGWTPVSGHAGRLLAMLVDAHPRPVAIAALTEGVWDGRPPSSAASALRVHLSRLRRLVEPVGFTIERSTVGYRLLGPPEGIDLVRAHHHHERARTLLRIDRNPAAAARHARRGLDLFGGAPFAPFAGEPTFRATAERADTLARALDDLEIDARMAIGDDTELVDRLEDRVRAEPFDERRWEQLMVGLYRAGRPQAALGAFQRARRVLRDALGTEPSPRLREVELAVLLHDPDLTRDRPGTASAQRPVVGRGPLLTKLGQLVPDQRLVTLVGAAGMGVSTVLDAFHREIGPDLDRPVLAVRTEARTPHLAAALLDAVSDGAGPDELAPSLEGDGSGDAALADLATRALDALVVLDLEGPPTDDADALAGILDALPDASFLVGSRRPLGLPGEVTVTLPPLDPADAIELLATTAEVEPTDPALAQVAAPACGHPLSIVLTAGLVGLVGLPAARRHLAEAGLSTTAVDPSAGRRFEIVRAALPEPTATALPALAAIRHDLDLGLVAAVAGLQPTEAAQVLADLRTAGLVIAGPGDGRPRLPVSLRDAAWAEAVADGSHHQVLHRRRRHLLRLVEPWGPETFGLRGPEVVAAIQPCEDELAALADEAERAGDADTVWALTAGRYWYWEAMGHIAAGDTWFARALPVLEAADHPGLPTALALAATFGGTMPRMAARGDLARRAVDLAGPTDGPAVATARIALAAQVLWKGDVAAAEDLLDQVTRAEHTWPFVGVVAGMYRGALALALGDPAEAERRLATAHLRATQLDSPWGEHIVLLYLGYAAELRGDEPRAAAMFRAALAKGEACTPGHDPDHARISLADLLPADDPERRRLYEIAIPHRLTAGDAAWAASALCGLGEVALAHGQRDEAGACFRHGLASAHQARDRQALLRALVGMGETAHADGDQELARLALAAATSDLRAGGRPPRQRDEERRQRLAAALGPGTPVVSGAQTPLEALVAENQVELAIAPRRRAPLAS